MDDKPDAIVMSDYKKGFLDEYIIGLITHWAREYNTPVFTDTKRIIGAWAKNAIVKINDQEFANHLNAGRGPAAWCDKLIVTHGAGGMDLYLADKLEYHCPATPIEVRDGAGCGDTVLAALVVRYLENGGDLRDAMDWAGKAGAIAVSRRGVVAVKREEVK